MATAPYVSYDTSAAGVATIEFGTPAHNSLPAAQLAELAEAFDRAGEDEACRAVVLRSGGDRTFCAGASFDELRAVATEDQGAAFFGGFARVIEAIRTCPKFVAARVQGKAIGGGVGLIAACDLAYASEFAAVRLSELSIGIGAFVIAPAVRRRIGTTALAKLSLSPTKFFAARAAQTMGLYAEVLATPDALDTTVSAKAAELASYGAEATAAWKQALWAGTEHWPTLLTERAALSGRLVTLPPAREALGGKRE